MIVGTGTPEDAGKHLVFASHAGDFFPDLQLGASLRNIQLLEAD